MTLEELSNSDLLDLYASVVAVDGKNSDYALEVKDEIYMRMEGGNEGA